MLAETSREAESEVHRGYECLDLLAVCVDDELRSGVDHRILDAYARSRGNAVIADVAAGDDVCADLKACAARVCSSCALSAWTARVCSIVGQI